MIPGKKFDPATETSRRPTPEKFAHLRSWLDVDTKFIDITNITELKNINLQLEQSSKLYVSNVVQRVIAQLLGSYGDGFITLEATEDGELKVFTDDKSPTILQVAISGSYNGGVELIAANATKKIKITNIFFVVSGAVGLKFMSDTTNLTGVMELGDTDEPRGLVAPFGSSPMETAVNKNFKLHASAAIDIMGYCNYYLE